MSQQFLNLPDDAVILQKGNMWAALAGPVLRQSGWRGCIWVQYVPPIGVDDFVVEIFDGTTIPCGWLPFPSEDYSDLTQGSPQNFLGVQLRTNQGSVAGASTVSIMRGHCRALHRYYERISLDAFGARTGPPIVYSLNEYLKVSENGLLCNDPDARLIAAGVVEPTIVGQCSLVPTIRNDFRLGADTFF